MKLIDKPSQPNPAFLANSVNQIIWWYFFFFNDTHSNSKKQENSAWKGKFTKKGEHFASGLAQVKCSAYQNRMYI